MSKAPQSSVILRRLSFDFAQDYNRITARATVRSVIPNGPSNDLEVEALLGDELVAKIIHLVESDIALRIHFTDARPSSTGKPMKGDEE